MNENKFSPAGGGRRPGCHYLSRADFPLLKWQRPPTPPSSLAPSLAVRGAPRQVGAGRPRDFCSGVASSPWGLPPSTHAHAHARGLRVHACGQTPPYRARRGTCLEAPRPGTPPAPPGPAPPEVWSSETLPRRPPPPRKVSRLPRTPKREPPGTSPTPVPHLPPRARPAPPRRAAHSPRLRQWRETRVWVRAAACGRCINRGGEDEASPGLRRVPRGPLPAAHGSCGAARGSGTSTWGLFSRSPFPALSCRGSFGGSAGTVRDGLLGYAVHEGEHVSGSARSSRGSQRGGGLLTEKSASGAPGPPRRPPPGANWRRRSGPQGAQASIGHGARAFGAETLEAGGGGGSLGKGERRFGVVVRGGRASSLSPAKAAALSRLRTPS
jgi:hypothetical protein